MEVSNTWIKFSFFDWKIKIKSLSKRKFIQSQSKIFLWAHLFIVFETIFSIIYCIYKVPTSDTFENLQKVLRGEIGEPFGGKLRYLTFWNMVRWFFKMNMKCLSHTIK